MTIAQLKEIFSKIIYHQLYIDNNLSSSLQAEWEQILKEIENNTNIINIIDEIATLKTNENENVLNNLLELITNSVYIGDTIIVRLFVNQNNYKDFPLNIYINLWNKLHSKEKVVYLKNKQNYSDLDIKLINISLNKSTNVHTNGVLNYFLYEPSILVNISDNCLNFIFDDDSVKHYDLNNELLFKKMTDSCYTNFIIKRFNNFANFNTYFKKHPTLIAKIIPGSLFFEVFSNDDLRETLLTEVNMYRIIKDSQKKLVLTADEINSKADNNVSLPIPKALDKVPNYSINSYPQNINELKKKPQDLLKYSKSIITMIINNEFTEEEKVTILRNNDFILKIDSTIIEQIFEGMPFKSAFNLLQSTTIFNKITNYYSQIDEKDVLLIKGFVDSPALIGITNHLMVKKMLDILSAEEVSYLITRPYILNKLSNGDIISLLSDKFININALDNQMIVINRLSNIDLVNYINNYWQNDTNLEIINNNLLLKKIFGITDQQLELINIKEVNYLFETIRTKSNLAIQRTDINVDSYRSVLHSYISLGLKKALELMANGNSKISLEGIKNYQKEIVDNKVLSFQLENSNIFDNLTNKVIEALNSIKIYDCFDLESIIMTNPFLADLIMLMRTNEFANQEDIISELSIYLNSHEDDFKKAKQRLFLFCNNFITFLSKNEELKQNNHYDQIIKQNYEVKESIAFNKREKDGKSYLRNLKTKILAKALTDVNNPDRYSYAFKKGFNCFELWDNLQKYLGVEDSDIKIITKDILIPLANNNFDMICCLKSFGIEKPNDYEAYQLFNQELEIVTNINAFLTENKGRYSIDKIMEFINYICYDVPLSFTTNPQEENTLKTFRLATKQFRNKIEINKVTMKLTHQENNINFNCEDIYLFDAYIEEIKGMIDKIKRFISYHMDEQAIKNHYYRNYSQYINQLPLNFPLSNKYYELKKRTFGINDFENLFNTYDLYKAEKLSGKITDKLFNEQYLYFMALFCENEDYQIGDVLVRLPQIENICHDLNINFSDLDFNDILALYNHISTNKDPVISVINQKTRSQYQRNYSPNNLSQIYQTSLAKTKSTLPYISGNIEEISYTAVSSFDDLNYGNMDYYYPDLTNYCMLNKNGLRVEVFDNSKQIGTINIIRNGNTVFIHPFELENCHETNLILNHIADNLIQSTKDNSESIDLVICCSNNSQINSNNIPINNSLDNYLKYPFNRQYEDYRTFMSTFVNSNQIPSEFDYYPSFILSSAIPISEKLVNSYDVTDKYERPRNQVKNISATATKKELDRINYLIYSYLNLNEEASDLIREYENINIDNYLVIYYGDDWVVLINKNGNIEEFILPYDSRAKEEAESIIQNITKEVKNNDSNRQSHRLQQK